MPLPQADESELFLRFSRRSLGAVLVAIVAIEVIFVVTIFWPDGAVAHTTTHMPWLLPMLLWGGVILLRMPLKGRSWDPQAPAVRAILDDEFRRANMARAYRVGFTAVLLAQFPLALLLMRVPGAHSVLLMAAATMTIGLAVLIAAFLYFDRG